MTLKVRFIVELNRLSRLSSALLGAEMLGWITTYIPSLIEQLETLGVSVSLDDGPDDDFDLVHVHIPGPTARTVMGRTTKPIIFHAHGTPLKTTNPVARYLRRKALGHFANRADAVIFPSRYTRGRYGALSSGKQVIALGNGVDLRKYAFSADQRAQFRRRWGIADHDILVVSVGWFIRRKGALDFIELARRNPEHTFMWVGGPPPRLALQAFLKLLSPSQVILASQLPPNLVLPGYLHDIPAALSAADIFLFPSWEENHPLALLEAAACQRPILARDIPALREWLEHERNGLLSNSLEDFQYYLDQLAHDAALRERLGRAARESVQQRFDIRLIAATLKGLYLSLGGI
jgi:1,2-diacylglycerol-3-alpha-glucose alpha-1,2-glucosyltransferase